MRPVDRGPTPLGADGKIKVYAHYSDARGDLYERLERYCSYCERRIAQGLAVEHIHNKDDYPDLEREWSNFLLACGNCNSVKGTNPVNNRKFMPDRDNTFRAFRYLSAGRIVCRESLSPAEKGKATSLLRLVGLDRKPTGDPKVSDMRWNDRYQAWAHAEHYKNYYDGSLVMIESIIDLVSASGHWSIWMTVFAEHPEVRLALIQVFPGTAKDCFDASGEAVPRPGGAI